MYANYPLRFESKVNFTIPSNMGILTDLCIHTSEEYLIVTTSHGFIYLYHLLTGQIVYKIESFSDKHAKPNISKCLFDPSGLYLCVLLKDNEIEIDDHINIYQIGTKEYIGSITNIGSINNFIFSNNGNAFYVISNNGIVKVLSISNGIRRNIQETLQLMKINDKFWSKYPFSSNIKKKFIANYSFVI